MEQDKLVSVIICVYKEPLSWVRQAFESIISQTYKNLEIISVLDDPASCGDLSAYLERLATEGTIRLIRNARNLGAGRSRQVAIENSRGEFIAIMDADDISTPERIEREMEAISFCDIVCSQAELIDEAGNTIGFSPDETPEINKTLPHGNIIFNPSVLIRKSAYEQCGGYRSLSVSEDYDLWLRMLLKGKVFSRIDQRLIKYRMRDTSLSHARSNVFKVHLTTSFLQSQYNRAKRSKKDTYSLEGLDEYLKKRNSPRKEALFFAGCKRFGKAKSLLAVSKVKGSLYLISCLAAHPVFMSKKIIAVLKSRF